MDYITSAGQPAAQKINIKIYFLLFFKFFLKSSFTHCDSYYKYIIQHLMTISKTEGFICHHVSGHYKYYIQENNCKVFSVFEALLNHVFDKFSINKGYYTLLTLLLSYYLVITS